MRVSVFLHNPRYRLFFLTSMISILGSVLFNIVFVIYARHMPDPKLAISVSSVLGTLPAIVSLFMGYLADQTRDHFARPLTNRLYQGGLYLVIALLLVRPASWPVFGGLLLLSFIGDLIGSYNSLASLTVIKDIVAPSDLTEAQGFEYGMNETLSVTGGLVGAALLSLLAYHYALFALLNALSFFAAFLLLHTVRHQFVGLPSRHFTPQVIHGVGPRLRHFGRTTWHNIRSLADYATLTRYILVFAMVNLAGAGMDPLLNLAYIHQHTLLFGNFGYTVALTGMCSSVGMIIGSLLPANLTRWLSIQTSVLLFYLDAFAIAVDILTVQNRWGILGLMAAGGLIMGIVNPRVGAEMITQLPEKMVGSLMSAFFTIIQLTLPVGALLFTGMANLGSLPLAWWGLGSYAVVGLLVSLGLFARHTTA